MPEVLNYLFYRKFPNNVSSSINKITSCRNPSEATISIDIFDAQKYTYTLSNAFGHVVKQGTVNKYGNTNSISELQKGIYFMTLNNSGVSSTIKAVKQ